MNADTCQLKSMNVQARTATIFTFLIAQSSIFVTGKFFTRVFVQPDHRPGAEDWATALTFLAWMAGTLLVLLDAVPRGLGKDPWELSVEDVEVIALDSWALQIIYTFSSGMYKLAFLFLYLRVFTERYMRRLLLTIVALVIGAIVVFVGFNIWTCRPVYFFWKQWVDKEMDGVCCTS